MWKTKIRIFICTWYFKVAFLCMHFWFNTRFGFFWTGIVFFLLSYLCTCGFCTKNQTLWLRKKIFIVSVTYIHRKQHFLPIWHTSMKQKTRKSRHISVFSKENWVEKQQKTKFKHVLIWIFGVQLFGEENSINFFCYFKRYCILQMMMAIAFQKSFHSICTKFEYLYYTYNSIYF